MKTSIKTALMVSVAISALGITSSAIANPRGGQAPQFETLDTNGDGFISSDELAALQADRFNETDLNGDGFLDETEIAEAAKERGQAGNRGNGKPGGAGPSPEKMAEGALERSDTDGDGMISMAEAEGSPFGNNFDNADTNGDGFIDAVELAAGIEQLRENRGNGNGQNGGRGNGQFDPAKMIARGDTDGDGVLSMEEATPPKAGEMIAKLDTDGDGMVSLEEWDARPQRGPGPNNDN